LKQPALVAHHLVSAEGREPKAWALVLHGIFGLGANFRTVARKVVERRPDWGMVLVDLRAHGESQGLPPPHDLDAVVGDLDALVAHLDRPVAGLIGHSFGGKVVLAYLHHHPGTMRAAFVLDSMPGPRHVGGDDVVSRVLVDLESIPQPIASREAFHADMTARGYAKGIVDWLSMNVRSRAEADGYGLRLDLPAIRALLDDYWARDFWPVVENPGAVDRLVMVLGGRSHVFDGAATARATEACTKNPRLVVETLREAGHWVHADDPEGVLGLIDKHLPTL
jgi:pimeloyl-ACP methyl ester carboxylesterase